MLKVFFRCKKCCNFSDFTIFAFVFADNELLRRQFAEKANAVGPWIERQLDAVTAIGMGLQVR